jgi:hypothetical protein
MTVIPPITDPMGRHWPQPPLSRVLVDDTYAVMSQADFDSTLEYSNTLPDGKYPGKMWRRNCGHGLWKLVWYSKSEDPEFLSINYRELLVA